MISPDGSWWWNGRSWQPRPLVAPPTVQPPGSQATVATSGGAQTGAHRGAPAWLQVGFYGGLILLGVLVLGGLGLSQMNSTPHANPNAAAYRSLTDKDQQKLKVALSAIQTQCAGTDTKACRAALVQLETSAKSFKSDLDQTNAPSCLTAGDLELKKAVGMYVTASDAAVSAIDKQSSSGIDAAASQLVEARTTMDQATSLINSASC